MVFWAEDPTGVYEILLDGKEKLYLIPGFHCDFPIQVYVTPRNKISNYFINLCFFCIFKDSIKIGHKSLNNKTPCDVYWRY